LCTPKYPFETFELIACSHMNTARFLVLEAQENLQRLALRESRRYQCCFELNLFDF
jgi:hypothetical protein